MNSCKPRIIHERSKIIPIPQTSPTNKKEGFSVNEYSLKQNFFDPSKNSPPNEFMLKLKLRMSHYESFNNVDNLINE
jgi:hypothetical protein